MSNVLYLQLSLTRNVDEVDETLDSLQEQLETAKEINDVLARPINRDIDDVIRSPLLFEFPTYLQNSDRFRSRIE